MTETKARAGEEHPAPKTAVAEAKSAVTGFLNAFIGFQEDVKISFQQQEKRMTMMDTKTMTYARPALSTAVRKICRIKTPLRPICAPAMTTGCAA